MECDRCGASMEAGACHEHGGKMLCDDCFMDASNPPKRQQVFIALF